MRLLITTFFILLIGALSAQNDSLKYNQVRFIKLNQSNDLFTYWYQSDKYFTDGVDIELAHPIFNIKIADKILYGFDTKFKDYSLSINQDMYTPENTKIRTIDSNDRPYAGQIYFTYAKYSNRFFEGKKIISSVFIGIQGPFAKAGEAQNFAHDVFNNSSINGWDNQISNGLILDYDVSYNSIIPLSSPVNELHYFVNAHIGTLNSSAEVGYRFIFGRYIDSYVNFYGIYNNRNACYFDSSDVAKMSKARRKIIPKYIRKQSLEQQARYLNRKMTRKFQLYFFTEGHISYILRDGSVQGSLIQFSDNIYEFNYDDYEHLKVLGRYGFVIQYSNFYMEYARYLQNDSFQDDGVFGYGKIILSWVF